MICTDLEADVISVGKVESSGDRVNRVHTVWELFDEQGQTSSGLVITLGEPFGSYTETVPFEVGTVDTASDFVVLTLRDTGGRTDEAGFKLAELSRTEWIDTAGRNLGVDGCAT